MIQPSDILPLLLKACPALQSRWDKHCKYWGSDPRGLYIDMAVAGHFLVDCMEMGNLEPIRAAFSVMEGLLTEGDEEIRGLVTIGLIEDVQNIASHQPFGLAAFEPFLGPRVREAWTQVVQMWEGKTSLADVVRDEVRRKRST